MRCRLEAGGIDQACGLMFRFADSDDYYVTCANALEGNVRLYRVIAGDRQQFASASAQVTANAWHSLWTKADSVTAFDDLEANAD